MAPGDEEMAEFWEALFGMIRRRNLSTYVSGSLSIESVNGMRRERDGTFVNGNSLNWMRKAT